MKKRTTCWATFVCEESMMVLSMTPKISNFVLYTKNETILSFNVGDEISENYFVKSITASTIKTTLINYFESFCAICFSDISEIMARSKVFDILWMQLRPQRGTWWDLNWTGLYIDLEFTITTRSLIPADVQYKKEKKGNRWAKKIEILTGTTQKKNHPADAPPSAYILDFHCLTILYYRGGTITTSLSTVKSIIWGIYAYSNTVLKNFKTIWTIWGLKALKNNYLITSNLTTETVSMFMT